MKKTRSKKSPDTDPLSILITNNVSTLLENELGCSSQILDTVLFHPATWIRIPITGIGVKKRGSWIHIRNTISDTTKLCRGSISGSSQIRITDRDDIHGMQIRIQPIRNCFQFNENEDVIIWSFQLKFQYAVQNIEIYDNFETS